MCSAVMATLSCASAGRCFGSPRGPVGSFGSRAGCAVLFTSNLPLWTAESCELSAVRLYLRVYGSALISPRRAAFFRANACSASSTATSPSSWLATRTSASSTRSSSHPQSVAESGRVILRPRAAFVVLALVAPFAVGGLAFCVRVVLHPANITPFNVRTFTVASGGPQEPTGEARGRRGLYPPTPAPLSLNRRPERRERDAELFGHMAPPNRPPSRWA